MEQYNKIMQVLRPVFTIAVVLFFLKEFSILFRWNLFVLWINDWIFLILFLIYAIFYITPFFYPETVVGFELPVVENIEDELELTDEEKELKELERISL